jgi:hypothetical protein
MMKKANLRKDKKHNGHQCHAMVAITTTVNDLMFLGTLIKKQLLRSFNKIWESSPKGLQRQDKRIYILGSQAMYCL